MRSLRSLVVLLLPLAATPAAAQDCLGLHRPARATTAEVTAQLAGGWHGRPTGVALGVSHRWLWASVERGADASGERSVLEGGRAAATAGVELVARERVGMCAGLGATRERVDAGVPMSSRAYGATLGASFRLTSGALPVALFTVARVEQRADRPSVEGFRAVYRETGAAYRAGLSAQLARVVGVRGFVDLREGELEPGMSLSLILGGGRTRPRAVAAPAAAPARPAAPAPAPAPAPDGDFDHDGVVDSRDRCASTPAGSAVDGDGCAVVGDADRDGVLDDMDRCAGTPEGEAVDGSGCVFDHDEDGVADARDACADTPRGTRVDPTGCPPRIFADRRKVVLEGVRFTSGTATLVPSSSAVLDRVATALMADPALRVEIAGHTDDRGTTSGNLLLSRVRAAAVASYLVSRGIDASRVVPRGYGSARPLASNATEAGRAANRRVELTPLE